MGDTDAPRKICTFCHVSTGFNYALYFGWKPAGGVVLDPFLGSGTTGRVALQNNRHYIGFEINPDYVQIAKEKTVVTPNLF